MAALAALIHFTGNDHVYRAVSFTYLRGRTGPGIEDYKKFKNNEVKAFYYRPIPNSTLYNKKSLSAESIADIEKYKTTAFLVVRNDSVVYEQYWDGFREDSPSNSFSVAKTIVSILVGIAIDEGKIKSVDQPVGDFIPRFKEGKNAELKIKHLLTMSSGINFDENYKSPVGYPAKAYFGSDINKITIAHNVVEDPGKNFIYLSGNTQILGIVLETATGKTLSDYAAEKLWMPIQSKNTALWSLDDQGNEKAYCCFNSNARDFSRIGSLYLHKGKWGEEQVVSEQYVNASIVPADLLNKWGKPNDAYGYSWWLTTYKDHTIFYARGILGQYIFVIPDKNMVIVRLGWERGEKKEGNDHPQDIYTYLNAALETF